MNLFRLLAQLVPVGTRLPILRGPLRGQWWIAGAAAGDGKGLSVVLNQSERSQLELARSLLTPESVCFDLGANVGIYTLLFGRYARCVYAFEPVPRNLHYLYKMAAINRLSNVTIVPWAVGKGLELTRFEMGADCSVGHLGAAGNQPSVCASVDAFVERYGVEPDLMKVDVEGAEKDVLAGCRRLFASKRPMILLSLHGVELRGLCLEMLRAAGYSYFRPIDAADLDSAAEIFAASQEPAPPPRLLRGCS